MIYKKGTVFQLLYYNQNDNDGNRMDHTKSYVFLHYRGRELAIARQGDDYGAMGSAYVKIYHVSEENIIEHPRASSLLMDTLNQNKTKKEKKEEKQHEWDVRHLKAATEIYSDAAKCSAKKVACILEKNGTIVSIGVNGTLSGRPNCNELFKKINGLWHRYDETIDYRWTVCEDQEQHHKWSKDNEVHAEINALGHAGEQGISTKGATAYITHSPCNHCSLALATFGIKRVVFKNLYDAEPEALERLREHGIEVVHLP